MAWGPIFYRGRLDGSARALVIGQDPGPDENVARRILVGSAGQWVQGFLRELGVSRSYVMVNAFLYSLKGQVDEEARRISQTTPIRTWRNTLLDMLATPQIEAVLAFGKGAHQVIDLWPGAGAHFVARLTHPSARDEAPLLANWNQGLQQLRQRVIADAGTPPSSAPYGSSFQPGDRAVIPGRDLPFGVPRWMGGGETAKRVKGKDAIVWKALDGDG